MVHINIAEFTDEEDEEFKGVKGSIVRLYMEDFVTYRKVEMLAGPHVNLILGLNGTGKSTIVCAICIGLAGKPTILGRANNLNAYIRRGATSSKIEIELFNPNGQNFTVKRQIKQTETGCVSEWLLNNKRAKLEDIEKLTKDLNIQLDNLCQFLPQDRVQEFAEMDNIRLLLKTEEVIGNDDSLSSKHQRLIEINDKIVQHEGSIQHVSKSLRTEEQLNLALESDVQTYRQREIIKKNMEELEQTIAWIKYMDAGAAFNIANSELVELTSAKKKKESSLIPLKKVIENLETHLAKFRSQMQKTRQTSSAKWYEIQRSYDTNKENVIVAVSEINVNLRQAERREEEKVNRINLLVQKIQSYEKEMTDFRARGEHDAKELKSQLIELESQRTSIMGEIININYLNDKEKTEKASLNYRITTSESELARLDDLRVSRMKFLERANPDVLTAVKYFEKPENKARLKGNIHEPMILHMCVNDLAYGKIAERHIGITDMTAFFCENVDDMETIFAVSKKLDIRISVIHHKMPLTFEKGRSSLTPEYMRKYHFKKVLLDLLEGPDYYMSYICRRFYPQDVPIGTAETDAMSKEIINSTNLRTFYTDSYVYQVQVSMYSGQKCTTTAFIRGQSPQIFTSEINAAERTRLQNSILILKEEFQKLVENISNRSDLLRSQTQQTEVIQIKIKDITARIEFKAHMEQKIKSTRDAADKLQKEVVDLTGMRQRASQECYAHRLQKLTALEGTESVISELRSNGLSHNVAKRHFCFVQTRCIAKQNQYEDAKIQVDEDNNLIKAQEVRVKSAAEIAGNLKREAMRKSQMDKPPQAVVDGRLQIADLEKTYRTEKGRLVHLADNDLDVVKRYEDKLIRIDALKKQKEELDLKNLSLKTEMQVLKDSWLAPLRDLIEKINKNFGHFFQTMQCDGQVHLDEAEQENDFRKYGIKIMVRFRKGEELSELCGWKQSGGERAISTALYVLALQELTTVPFRVIDEINQGMDAHNETRFFNLLCSLATGNNTPQYFLLTPKMLPAVEYHDNVSFHFIFNGPHVKNVFQYDGEESDATGADEGQMGRVSLVGTTVDETSEEEDGESSDN